MCRRRTPADLPPPSHWVLRDVVFQDVGFQTISLKSLSHISFRCEVPTPSVVEGQSTIMFRPQSLKHHIPEFPISPQKISDSLQDLPISFHFRRSPPLFRISRSHFQENPRLPFPPRRRRDAGSAACLYHII